MTQHACRLCGSTRTALSVFMTTEGPSLACENVAGCRSRCAAGAPIPEDMRGPIGATESSVSVAPFLPRTDDLGPHSYDRPYIGFGPCIACGAGKGDPTHNQLDQLDAELRAQPNATLRAVASFGTTHFSSVAELELTRRSEAERMGTEIDLILAEIKVNPHTFTEDPSEPRRCCFELPSGWECGGEPEDPEHA